MISVSQAQALVRSQCTPLAAEVLPASETLGRVLASDLISPAALPPFDNSAMDGYALRCDGVPIREGTEFAVRGELAAGAGHFRATGEGAWAIMTGAPVPSSLDSVVPVEQVDILATAEDGCPTRIRLTTAVRPGQHVRRAGEDIACGVLAARSGSWLDPAHLMLLAALGIDTVPVVRRPKVAVLCTGRELVDDTALPLQWGQIRNSNGSFLAARLPMAGAELEYLETVPDDPAVFKAALARALQADAGIVLSTGAVSMGRYDFVPSVLQALGAELLFHKVAMRPGKPLLFARLPGGQLYFGLPGNPVSSAVGLRFFVEAAIRRQLGLSDEKPWRLPFAHDVCKSPGLCWIQKAALQLVSDGRLQVVLLRGQESFKTFPLLATKAWAVLPEAAMNLPAGTLVDVFPLGHEASGMFGESMP
jgi:molybdopterin molybdotransferase